MKSKLRAAWISIPWMLLPVVGQSEERKLNFSRDVAPILYKNCVSCHRPGEIGGFSLLDYASARPWAKAIRNAVHSRRMPPWHADSSKVRYANDRSLSENDILTIVQWVNQGAVEGERADLPPKPLFDESWAMGTPDLIFEAEEDFTVPAHKDRIEYQSIHFKADVTEDLYITEWEILPRERSVVHHANLVRAPVRLKVVGIGQAVAGGGDYIGSYLPGARPFRYPVGTALRIPAGTKLSIQVHYVGGEREVADRIRFGVRFADGRIDKIIRAVGTDDYEISIEPGQEDWKINSEVTLLYDLTLLSSGAHMHLRGKSYTMKVILLDGTERLVTDVPRYDFNWQSNYQLAEPLSVPKNTRLQVEAHWDNSSKNPNNPDPAARVVYGPWTENEMLTTWAHAVLTDEKLGLKVKDGRVVGRFDDAVGGQHPFLLQTLPKTMQARK